MSFTLQHPTTPTMNLSVNLCFTANMMLAEKSITLNSSELNKLKALADEKGLVLAEAMTIWHMPLYKSSGRLSKAVRLADLR